MTKVLSQTTYHSPDTRKRYRDAIRQGREILLSPPLPPSLPSQSPIMPPSSLFLDRVIFFDNVDSTPQYYLPFLHVLPKQMVLANTTDHVPYVIYSAWGLHACILHLCLSLSLLWTSSGSIYGDGIETARGRVSLTNSTSDGNFFPLLPVDAVFLRVIVVFLFLFFSVFEPIRARPPFT